MSSRALLVALLCMLCVHAADAQESAPWPMFRADGLHTGRSSSTGPTLPSTRWRMDLRAPAYASPVVTADGTVITASSEALIAVARDGVPQWRVDLNAFTVASPALSPQGTVIVASTDGTVEAVEATTGAVRWTTSVDGEVWASPMIGSSGEVYVATTEGVVAALELESGDEHWRQRLPDRVIATPALGDNRLYVIDTNGTLTLVDTATGAIRYRFGLPTEVVSSPTVNNEGLVLVGGLNGSLYAIDPAAGAEPIRWSVPVGGEIISSPALAADGTLYVGTSGGEVIALDASTGQRRWGTPVGAPVLSSPALDAAGRLYVGLADTVAVTGAVAALDGRDGTRLWTYETAGPTWSSPALDADGDLLAASVGTLHAPGQLYRIEAASLSVETSGEPVAGADHEVGVSPAPDFSPTGGTVYYRPGGSSRYASTPLVASGGKTPFSASIPASAVTLRGLEYYVEMTDGTRTVSLPASEPDTRPLAERVLVDEMELPRELPVRGYSMISVPAELDDPSIEQVLVDDYGEAGLASWRLFRWVDGAYAEYPSLRTPFEPGTAFFLIHRSGEPFSIGRALSVDTSTPFVVTLQPGWNQVGVPFAFPISLDDVEVRDAPSEAVREIAFFDGEQMLQGTLEAPGSIGPLQPWNGYFFRNTLDRPVDIAFHPSEASTAAASDAVAAHAAARHEGYTMHLAARALSGTLIDTQNWLGLRPTARTGRDVFDQQEAPPPGTHLRLSLVDGDARYASDMRPASEDGQRWHLELALAPSPQHAEWIEVQLSETGARPPGHELHVVDDDARQQLRVVDGRLRVRVGGKQPVRHLSVVLGTPAFAADVLDGVDEQPATFYLDQNAPNPFTSTTAIPYRVDQPEHVTLQVFDVMGRHVATLVDEALEAGQHTATWDGRTRTGQPLASGLYLYRLRIGSESETRRMVLLR